MDTVSQAPIYLYQAMRLACASQAAESSIRPEALRRALDHLRDLCNAHPDIACGYLGMGYVEEATVLNHAREIEQNNTSSILDTEFARAQKAAGKTTSARESAAHDPFRVIDSYTSLFEVPLDVRRFLVSDHTFYMLVEPYGVSHLELVENAARNLDVGFSTIRVRAGKDLAEDLYRALAEHQREPLLIVHRPASGMLFIEEYAETLAIIRDLAERSVVFRPASASASLPEQIVLDGKVVVIEEAFHEHLDTVEPFPGVRGLYVVGSFVDSVHRATWTLDSNSFEGDPSRQDRFIKLLAAAIKSFPDELSIRTESGQPYVSTLLNSEALYPDSDSTESQGLPPWIKKTLRQHQTTLQGFTETARTALLNTKQAKEV